MTILHRVVVLPARVVNEENAVLTLAVATIVVLTVTSLALMLWPEPSSPMPSSDGEQETEDAITSADGGERDRITLPEA